MKFQTERLELREIAEADAEDILLLRSNEDVNRFINRKPPKKLQDAIDFIAVIKENTKNSQTLYLAISKKNSDRIIGSICLWKFTEDRKTAEVGYELLPEFHHQGIMSEALNFILNYGFKDLKLEKIEAFTHKDNLNSIALLEKFNFKRNENRFDEGVPENAIFELSTIK